MRGALQAQPLHAGAQLRVDQQVAHGPHHLAFDFGSNNSAAESATSGIAEVFEQATARPHAIASIIGSPKPS